MDGFKIWFLTTNLQFYIVKMTHIQIIQNCTKQTVPILGESVLKDIHVYKYIHAVLIHSLFHLCWNKYNAYLYSEYHIVQMCKSFL